MKSGTFPPQRLFPTHSWFNNIKDGHYLPAKLLYVYRSKIEMIFACVGVAVLNATLGVTNDSTTDWITIYFPPCYWRIPRALSNPLCVEINGTNIENMGPFLSWQMFDYKWMTKNQILTNLTFMGGKLVCFFCFFLFLFFFGGGDLSTDYFLFYTFRNITNEPVF